MKTDKREKKMVFKSGTRTWYLCKILELLLIFLCLLLLCLSRFMFHILDDFSVAYQTNNSSAKLLNNLLAKYSELDSKQKIDKSMESYMLNNVSDLLISKEDKDHLRRTVLCNAMPLVHYHQSNTDAIKLIDLLIMFPCCCTIIIIIIMEIVGHILQDPFNKWSNLIYLCLADGLSICIFAKSIESSIDNWQFNMVCNIVFSGALQVIIAVNIVLLCFS